MRKLTIQTLEDRKLLAAEVIDLGSQVVILGDQNQPNEIRIVDAENGGLDIITQSGQEEPVTVNVRGAEGFFGQLLIAGGSEADVITIETDRYYRSTILGGGGDDVITGGAGVDYVLGGAGNDTLRGNAGRDFLYGEAGDDQIFGGEDNDWLSGGEGADLLVGGPGIDGYWADSQDDLRTDDDDRFIYFTDSDLAPA